jgi:hypothetical protein
MAAVFVCVCVCAHARVHACAYVRDREQKAEFPKVEQRKLSSQVNET